MKAVIRISVIILVSIVLTVTLFFLMPANEVQYCFSGHSEVSLNVESFDETNKVINVKWHNNSSKTIMPKNGCVVYKEVQGKWELLDATPATLIAVYIAPGETYDEIYRVSHIDMSEPGKYKIETEFSMGEENYSISLEFVK